MASENLYQLLNIPEYSDISVVKQAFRHLALKYHPDRNKEAGAADKFKAFLNAYEVLGDLSTKAIYDQKLRFGQQTHSTYQAPIQSAKDERMQKMRQYARMKQERDAIEEVENLKKYENALEFFPFKWRMILTALCYLLGIFFIINGWYQTSSIIALGFIVFIVCVMAFWNEIYKYFWHRQLSDKDAPKLQKDFYDVLSKKYAFRIIFWGITCTSLLIYSKKKWHLSQFAEVVEAKLDTSYGRIRYEYKGIYYEDNTHFIPSKYKYQEVVYIKVSSMEPEIWDYVE